VRKKSLETWSPYRPPRLSNTPLHAALADEALGWMQRNAVRVASILTADMENGQDCCHKVAPCNIDSRLNAHSPGSFMNAITSAKAEEQRITVQKVSTSLRLWVLQRCVRGRASETVPVLTSSYLNK
jgi:hypothetical protein